MATIDYKEKYEAALERCKKLYNEAKANEYTSDIEDYETIFPELKEKEDEKIRQLLIRFVKYDMPNNYSDDFSKEDCLAWLEKRGEQKPTFEMKTPEESLGIDSNTYNKIVDKCIYGDGNESTWSEEDEQYLLVCKNALAKYQKTDKWDASIIFHWLENKLKSLRPRPHWKPSDEQMNTLEQWLKDNQYKGDARYCYPIFESLYQDLKKLKE